MGSWKERNDIKINQLRAGEGGTFANPILTEEARSTYVYVLVMKLSRAREMVGDMRGKEMARLCNSISEL